jgi:hypothetical protein
MLILFFKFLLVFRFSVSFIVDNMGWFLIEATVAGPDYCALASVYEVIVFC